MFFVLFCGAQIYKDDGFPTRKHATYSCPCAKQGNSKLIPQTSNDWPCDLFMVIAKASRTGNCSRLKSNGKSVGIVGIRGIKTSSPLYFPLMVVGLDDVIQLFHNQSRYIAYSRLINVKQHYDN